MRSLLLGSTVLLWAASVFAGAADNKTVQEPRYDPAAKIDVKLTVTDVRDVAAGNALVGLHLTAKNGTDTFDVYVGPTDFVKEFEGNFEKGDQLQVIGCRVKADSGDIILAKEIKKGETSLLLRDDQGTPNWKYWKKAK